MNPQKPTGPDPAVHEAVHGLTRTELSPLEEAMFQSWSAANQVEDQVDSPDAAIDLRNVYKQTGGKVLPPGQLKRHAEKASHIKVLMDAQEAHDKSSPIQALMEAQTSTGNGSTEPVGHGIQSMMGGVGN